MIRPTRLQDFRFSLRAVAFAATLAFSVSAQAVEPALNSLGQAGGLVIPYAFALPEGVAEAQYNDYIDPRFGKQATGSQVYWGAVGLLPYVEVAGGLVNYPGDRPAPFSGADHFVLRHLMADVKVQVPTFFKYQPAIAFGITDLGGQTRYFRSTYGVVSQAFGPATLTLGYGSGDRLDGLFGGLQLALWNTGVSLLAEDDSKTRYAGVRYQSPAITWLADASVIGTVTRSIGKTDGVSPRTSVAIGLQIPLGKRFSAERCMDGLCEEASARAEASLDKSPEHVITKMLAPLAVPVAGDSRFDNGPLTYTPPLAVYASAYVSDASTGTLQPVADTFDTGSLDVIAQRLFAAGLERVRVGLSGRDLIVEYENHRYNQNEADALGIVFGVASAEAPQGIERIHAVIKKANEPLAEVVVDRDAYAQFMAGGSPGAASASMTMNARPGSADASIDWHGDERRHGLTRIQIEPVLSYLYGTDYGNFDVSAAANIEGFVPLWRGAELYASYIAPLFNTKNMDDGRVFGAYRIRGGLSAVALGQSFWIMPQVFNVAAVGKFDYDYVGVQNETTVFVPGRPDMIRLRLAYLHHEPGHDTLPSEKNAALTYRWVQPAWKLWVEAGVARYVGGDKGPLITLTRWFDDVSFSVHGEHSGQGSFVGASVSFPLTPRQGMKPGITQLDGAEQFSLDFRTRVGATNYLGGNAAENLGFAYSTQQFLLNQGRFSGEYFGTQLYRMRDSYLRYAKPAPETPKPAPTAQATASATLSAALCGRRSQAAQQHPKPVSVPCP
ncbi:YjbH domain-containing protein [Paraburkholderia domus]|jgi:Bacterial putative lipoprotein (DUF940).|uniref:Exopolysaccharide biosynthesis protein YbjH n=1 Tax=Paraburkholderia domus TaxID=2793075 RepID=A0A9N8QUG3_9BURK|nr:YjbH domain-containing protein [Paraburkholderia domus]MBK5049055.1 YjbH domain-containing protein [Burkholderia sp. R-70006]MBK5118286.1 YjbH domain-containing protein [Burkholderia sp. R-69980]MBK5164125.1 YjbH domain-containing protein [Burkholderia sp. R-70211]MCI0144373.1 YjbH domain-containing protein [Paraburkholderia sediminicola]CAE6735152.1 hypothetical protein R70006_02300 [Paraburkholderia domus]